MRSVSFLIGSGFSVPAGYPTTEALNARMCRIAVSDICIHTSGSARFLQGQLDPNAHFMQLEERRFVNEFLEFYSEHILTPDQQFHYETFYDFYRPLCDDQAYPDSVNNFLEEFRRRHSIEKSSHNLLSDFNLAFNQLIAQLLTKDLRRAHLAAPYAENCNAFLQLVGALAKTHRIHFHTLNHDLYMEHLAYSDSIQAELDDGFEELGSPFYAEVNSINDRYKVRLSRFTEKYERQFCLYKLHGSIDFYWVRDGQNLHLLKRHRGAEPDFYQEKIQDGVLKYVPHTAYFHPEFLSGKKYKIDQYETGPYYPGILNRFSSNLADSNTLIVIGYGFGDSKINAHLEKFLDNSRKVMFIVDIKRPDSKYLERGGVFFIDNGVTGMDINNILGKWRQ